MPELQTFSHAGGRAPNFQCSCHHYYLQQYACLPACLAITHFCLPNSITHLHLDDRHVGIRHSQQVLHLRAALLFVVVVQERGATQSKTRTRTAGWQPQRAQGRNIDTQHSNKNNHTTQCPHKQPSYSYARMRAPQGCSAGCVAQTRKSPSLSWHNWARCTACQCQHLLFEWHGCSWKWQGVSLHTALHTCSCIVCADS